VDDPPLESKGTGGLTACHFPLTREEALERLPLVLAGRGENPAGAESAADAWPRLEGDET
jgi:hypothetical protein